MRFYTVCTLPHYFPKDVYKLHQQLQLFYRGRVEMYVYTDRPEEFDNSVNVIKIQHSLCQRQWYKVDFFRPGFITTDEPVIVMDLDWIILNDITGIVNQPIIPTQFATVHGWWRTSARRLKINGGMYKFFPNTLGKAYNIFYSNPQFWQRTYFGVNKIQGEQDFVTDVVPLTHEIVLFPSHKICRSSQHHSTNTRYAETYQLLFGEPLIDKDVINKRVALLHGRSFFS